MTADELPFDPIPDVETDDGNQHLGLPLVAVGRMASPSEKRRPGRPRGSGRTKTLAEANEVPDLAYVVWRQQEDVDGKPYVLVMEATVDPLRALELLELNRGAFVESVDLT